MEKLTRIVFAVLLAGCVAAAVWMSLRPRVHEAVFNGRPATWWVKSLGDGTMDTPQLQTTWRTFGPAAVPYLARALEQRDGPLRLLYSRLCPRLPTALKKHLPLPVDSILVRLNAAAVFECWPEGAKLAVPSLERAMKDKERTVRGNVAGALGAVGKGHPEVVPLLASGLDDEDPIVRENAAGSLWEIGPAASGAVPSLLGALKDASALVRTKAAGALLRVDPEGSSKGQALALLMQSLEAGDPHVRSSAALGLDRDGHDAALIVPALVRALRKDAIAWVRCDAARALGQMGKEAQPAIPALLAALEDSDSDVRHNAARALQRINPSAASKAGIQ